MVRAWILEKWTKYYLDANFIFNPLKAAVEWESRVTKRRYSIISEWRKRVRGLEKEDIERFKGARWNFFFFYLVFKKNLLSVYQLIVAILPTRHKRSTISSLNLKRGISKVIESLNFLLFVLISFREIYSFE